MAATHPEPDFREVLDSLRQEIERPLAELAAEVETTLREESLTLSVPERGQAETLAALCLDLKVLTQRYFDAP